jgi:N-acetylglucosaminyl-diphospho-decaprenol L-rhamnosyltransferase
VPEAVTIAVVSWNTRELLQRCLRSLAADAGAGRADVWIVDNGSSDGSVEVARTEAPWATVVEAGDNLGFGRAVNLVARRTQGEWLAAANADIALEPGALTALLTAGTDPRTACVAPRLVLPDGSTQQSVHPFPTLPFTLAFNLGLHRVIPGLGARLCLEGFMDAEQPREVPWAIGAFMLLRRAAFEAVGGFDDTQWMYAEDLDLAWRLRDAGWATRYEPRARVRHESSAAAAVAFGDRATARFMTATYAVLVSRRGRARASLTAALNVAGAAARLAWMRPLARYRPRWREPRDAMRVWLDAHRRGVRALSARSRPPRTPAAR